MAKTIINSFNLNILPMNATHFFPGWVPSLLDLMVVSSNERVATFGQISAEAFSYHDLVYLSYKIRALKLKPSVIMQRCSNNIEIYITSRDAAAQCLSVNATVMSSTPIE